MNELLSHERIATGEGLGLSREWQEWVTHNALEGASPRALVEALMEEGLPEREAAREVSALLTSAPFEAARRWRREAMRLRLLSRLMVSVQALGAHEVERVSGVDLKELQDRYLRWSRPVILTDVIHDAPALTLWSDAHLKARAGDVIVSCCEGREGREEREGARAPGLFKHLVKELPFHELIDRVAALEESDDLYLIGNNRFFECPGTAPLLQDLGPRLNAYIPEGALNPKRCWMWFGPKGTRTPLHYDLTSALYVQVRGEKRFRLLSPHNLPAMMNLRRGTFCELGVEEAAAQMQERAYEVVVRAGEVLVLPAGWWHEVVALSASLSVSVSAPAHLGQYAWYQLAGV